MNKFCGNCGKKIEENTVYCPKCGEQINKSEPVNNQHQQVVHTKQCRFCMKEIDRDATVCPYCRQGQKRGVGCGMIILWGFVLIIIAGIFLAVTGRSGILNKNDLSIENARGGYSALGVGAWEGDLVNKGGSTIENIVIKYLCYNDSKEVIGTVQTKIKRIEGHETIHFQATGIVKYAENVTCESSINIVSTDEFNGD